MSVGSTKETSGSSTVQQRVLPTDNGPTFDIFEPRSLAVALFGFFLVSIAFIGALGLPNKDWGWNLNHGAVVASAVLATGLLGYRAWRSPQQERIFWAAFALGSFCGLLAHAYAFILSEGSQARIIIGQPPSFLICGMLACFLFNIVQQVTRSSNLPYALRTLAEGTLISCSLVAMVWSLTFGQSMTTVEGSWATQVSIVALPCLSLSILVCSVLIRQPEYTFTWTWVELIMFALPLRTLADFGYTLATLENSTTVEMWSRVAAVAFYALIAWAGISGLNRSSIFAPLPMAKPRPEWFFIAMCAVGVAACVATIMPSEATIPWVIMGILVCLMIARQGIILQENSVLMKELDSKRGEMQHQAFHDALTGLANRALFHDRLDLALASRNRTSLTLVVFFIDLDDFKDINDSLGHDVGDELLRQVAVRLRDNVRKSDTVARLGGDEFAVISFTPDPQSAAERLRQVFTGTVRVSGHDLPPRASIGMVSMTPLDAPMSANDLLRRADIAMYSAKRAGKGQLRLFARDTWSADAVQFDLRAALEQAINNDEITLTMKAVCKSKRLELIGLEAIPSWHHRGKDVPQEEFERVARRYDLLESLDRIVLDHAVAAIADTARVMQRDDLFCIVPMSDKILSVTAPDLATTCADLLYSHRVSGHRLILKITVLPQQNLELLARTMRDLAELDIRVMLRFHDESGASLITLGRLPVAGVTFNPSLFDGTPSSLWLKGFVDLVHRLGLTLLVEGLDSQEDLDRFSRVGCDWVQSTLADAYHGIDSLASHRTWRRPTQVPTSPST